MSCENLGKRTKESISFYQVPLVCGAAPEIGCGSRIKPLFIETEKVDAIKESWTNRQGTIIAIVWDAPLTHDIRIQLQNLFEKHDVEAELIKDTSQIKELKASFRDKGRWYKGMDVDQLSIEEAGVIAVEATGFAVEEGLIDSNEAKTIKRNIEDFFKSELVKVRTLENLSSDSTQVFWKRSAHTIFVNHVGKERADKISQLYQKKIRK